MKSNSFLRNRRVFTTALLLGTGFMASYPLAASSVDEVAAVWSVQQQQTIKGVVVDAAGEPVIGANVVVEGTATGTITDYDGNFSISVPKNGKIKISFIGYKDQIVTVKPGKDLRIVLEDDSQMLGEVQIVAYGVQKKVSITGAISSMKGDDLLKTPTGSISNVLAGAVTGVTSVQYSGEPGADAADLYVRGVSTWNNSAPLIQVDGVERDFSQIDPNEIESITVLKDASATAVFGVRGANGVILITTKRGAEGKAKISFSTSFSAQMPTKLLEMANGYQYATFRNEMDMNDGAEKGTYSDAMIEALRTHSDPLRYPDIDWMDYILKDASLQTQHNMNISGGTDKVRYFISVGAFSQNGLFKTFSTGYDYNYDYKRYNYRANLDFDVTKSTLLSVNLGGRVENKRTPISNEDQNQLFRHLYWATPFGGAGIVDGQRVVSNPDDFNNAAGSDGLSPFYGKGYKTRSKNVLNLDVTLNQKLDFIIQGLAFKIKGSYNSDYTSIKERGASAAYYVPVPDENGGINYRKEGSDSPLGYGESYEQGRNWYAEASLNYARSFGDHNVSALALYNQSKTYYPKTYAAIPTGYVGMVGRVTYDFKTRYMAEFNVGYNGSENFAPDKRYGFFPAGSIGWIISEEGFFKPLKKAVNYLKLRASYGVVGNDKYGDERFLYLPESYYLGGGWNFGTNTGSNKPGAYEGAKTNQNVTWEKAYKQNYGIDFSVLDERLKVSADYFVEHRNDILKKFDSAPGFVGISLPVMNIGETKSWGYEFSLKWNDKIGSDFRYYVNANLSYAQNKIIEQGEVRKDEPYMQTTGHPIGSRFIRKFWGFYDETANERYKAQFGQDIPEHAGGLEPGDCVYIDLNNDGVIDNKDICKIGYTDRPAYLLGLNLGFSWKGWDVSMQWSGAWNVNRLLQETFRQPLGDTYNKGLLLAQYENRWTPETAATATLPRASSLHAKNNYADSDLFLVNASYLRLKNIEIGYNFNLPFMEKIKMNSCRIYVSGYNLLTFTGFEWGDPESKTSDRPAYPLTRVFNIGLKVGF